MNESEGELLAEFLVLQTSEEEEHQWTHQNTLTFLDLYKKYREQVGSLKIKNLKKMFEEIAKEMQYITKTNISGAKCENRWKVLERNYKKYIDNAKKTGRGRKVFEYADVMHNILGKKKNIHPVLLLSSDTINTPEEIATETEVVEREAESNVTDEKTKPVTSNIKKQKTTAENKRLKYNILKEIRSDRKEYYKKRVELEEKKVTEKKRHNDLLEKRNDLLKAYLEKK